MAAARTALDQVRGWLTPILVVTLGYMAKSKLESIDQKIDKISALEVRVALVEEKQRANESTLMDLWYKMYHMPAKKEDEITLNK